MFPTYPHNLPLFAGGTPQPKSRGVATALLLDSLTGAVAAYSVRKLRTAYAGSALRLRRDSDNAEQDVGFIGSNLDTASAATFIGGGNGYGATFYDQVGSYDLTQSTAAQQALYSATGGAGSKPCFTFDATDDIFARTASKPTLSTGVTYLAVVKYTTDSRYLCAIGGAYNGAGVRLWVIAPNWRFNLQTAAQSPADLVKAGAATSFQLVTARYAAATGVRELWINGGTVATDTLTPSNLNQNATLMFLGGAQHDTLVYSYFGGSVCEWIVCNAAISDAEKTALQSNIATYYGITLT